MIATPAPQENDAPVVAEQLTRLEHNGDEERRSRDRFWITLSFAIGFALIGLLAGAWIAAFENGIIDWVEFRQVALDDAGLQQDKSIGLWLYGVTLVSFVMLLVAIRGQRSKSVVRLLGVVTAALVVAWGVAVWNANETLSTVDERLYGDRPTELHPARSPVLNVGLGHCLVKWTVVPADTDVDLQVRNIGDAEMRFVLESAGVDQRIKGHTDASIAVNLPPGDHDVTCQIPNTDRFSRATIIAVP